MAIFRIFSLISLFFLLGATKADLVINMQTVADDGQGKNIGTVTISHAKCGVMITPNLHDLTPGMHGFHIHQNPSCGDKAMAAGGHLDPAKTESHEGPYQNKGHLGDLPVLMVDKDGNATTPALAPNLTMADFENHALMIHMNGDNYSDTPEKLGGGGARIACGVPSQS
jgi:superoxide dismutase, Cu-Zn family